MSNWFLYYGHVPTFRVKMPPKSVLRQGHRSIDKMIRSARAVIVSSKQSNKATFFWMQIKRVLAALVPLPSSSRRLLPHHFSSYLHTLLVGRARCLSAASIMTTTAFQLPDTKVPVVSPEWLAQNLQHVKVSSWLRTLLTSLERKFLPDARGRIIITLHIFLAASHDISTVKIRAYLLEHSRHSCCASGLTRLAVAAMLHIAGSPHRPRSSKISVIHNCMMPNCCSGVEPHESILGDSSWTALLEIVAARYLLPDR